VRFVLRNHDEPNGQAFRWRERDAIGDSWSLSKLLTGEKSTAAICNFLGGAHRSEKCMLPCVENSTAPKVLWWARLYSRIVEFSNERLNKKLFVISKKRRIDRLRQSAKSIVLVLAKDVRSAPRCLGNRRYRAKALWEGVHEEQTRVLGNEVLHVAG
jgi:hypothetical protein